MKTRATAFGALLGLLAAADWFAPEGNAGDDPRKQELKIGSIIVTCAVREIDVDGHKERHAFLETSSKTTGSVTVRLLETPPSSPMSRMGPIPKVAWERAIDLERAPVDLGLLKTPAKGRSLSIVASADGKTFVPLFSENVIGPAGD